jgi:hypothetical protein
MDWDKAMISDYSNEPLTAESYRQSLQSPGVVYKAMQAGSIAKPSITDIIKLYPDHFGKLCSFADRHGIPHKELLDWITDYISWSEAEDFIER